MNTVTGFEEKRNQNTRLFYELTRKIMYAALLPHTKGDLKENEVLEFEWEKAKIQQMSIDEMVEMQEQEALTKAFFDRWDQAEKIKA
jgi:hypothetical protein